MLNKFTFSQAFRGQLEFEKSVPDLTSNYV